MQIAICDDEESVRKILEEKIKQYNPNGETVSYSSGEQLLLAENPLSDGTLWEVQTALCFR